MAVIPTTTKCPQCGELLKWEPAKGFFDAKGHQYESLPSGPLPVAAVPEPEVAEADNSRTLGRVLAPQMGIGGDISLASWTVAAAPEPTQEASKPPDPPKAPAIPVRTLPEAPGPAAGGPGVVFAPNGDALVTLRIQQHHWSGLEAACRSGSWGEALKYFNDRVNQAFQDRWFW